MDDVVDVVVIGAGPSGLIASQDLDRNDVQYTLIERHSSPGRTKPCGGFIPIRAIHEFGIGRINGQHDIHSVRIKMKKQDMVRVYFDRPVGVNIRREDLASKLLDDLSTGVLRLNTTATKVETNNDRCLTTIETCSGREVIQSQLVIDASGVNPVTQRFVKLRERPSNSQLGYAVQYHLMRKEEFEGVNDFYYGSEYSPRGYAWAFPCKNIAVVGTGGLIDRVRASERRTEEYLQYLISKAEPAKTELEGSEIVRKESALMPLAGIVEPSCGKRILLAGDAACHCSPISGEGIYYSMIGGQEAAKTAIDCLNKKDFSDRRLSKYEKLWKRRMGSDLKWGHYLQRKFTGKGSSSSTTRDSLLTSTKSYRTIAEMLVGERTVRSAILRVAPSYLKSKIF
ncbi:NAD(P)/FAD-dependent oxidoreductase [Candidatus Thorarchaeota archaeon]|nr:MAG: NAD(P)/FAD-dependent oxidoreductase [Candidatus Thorarchaeota archaeon]